jgi:hypothetical protein
MLVGQILPVAGTDDLSAGIVAKNQSRESHSGRVGFKALLVAPGKHKIKISLPGYHTFETEIDLMANQKSTVKTEMVAGGPAEGTPLPQ